MSVSVGMVSERVRMHSDLGKESRPFGKTTKAASLLHSLRRDPRDWTGEERPETCFQRQGGFASSHSKTLMALIL